MRTHLIALTGCTLSLSLFVSGVSGQEALLPVRDVWVKPDVEPGGSGERNDPYASIQEAVDRHNALWGRVFLYPAVYREHVDVHRGRFWFVPWTGIRPDTRHLEAGGLTDPLIEGSITVRRPGLTIKGLDFRSEGSAVILAEGSGGDRLTIISRNRFHAVGEGAAAIDVLGDHVANALITANIVDLRNGDGDGRTGIRVRVGAGVRDIRVDHNQIAGCATGIAVVAAEGYTDETNVLSQNRLLGNGTGVMIGAPGITTVGNECRGNTLAGLHIQAGPTLIDANTLIGNAVGIIGAAEDVTLTSNIIANPEAQAVRVTSGNAKLLHNTIHAEADTESALLETAAGTTTQLRYTILSGSGTLISAAGELSASHNLYSHPPVTADDHALVGAPGFLAPHNHDYRIDERSPAAHQVETVEVGHDAAGNGRPWGQGASIGAYEAPGRRAGTSYHVAAGVEGGDGSANAPFSAIAEALQLARPGDTVLVHPGSYAAGVVAVTRSGAPGLPITIRAEPLHAAKVAGTRFQLRNCAYVRIEGFDFTGFDGAPPIQCGPYVRRCEFVGNLIVREQNGGGAISIGGPGASHNLVEGNRIALTRGGVGVNVAPEYHNHSITVRGNDISGCYYGVLGGGDITPHGYHIIENNRIHHNWKDGIHPKTTDTIIRNNHLHDNAASAVTTRSGGRAVIVGNWIHDNGRGIRLHDSSHFVLNNVIYNNRDGGILAAAPSMYFATDDVWIAHNTFWGNGNAAITLEELSRANILRNIIVGRDPRRYDIVRRPGGKVGQAAANLYHNTRQPLFHDEEGGLYERTGDPLLRDPENGDFRPGPLSPALDMPNLNDALSTVLSPAPAGVPLPTHLGANLGPPEP